MSNSGRINSNTVEEQRRAERMERNVRRSRGHDADPVGEDEFLSDAWVIEKTEPGMAGSYEIVDPGGFDVSEDVVMRVENWEIDPSDQIIVEGPSDRTQGEAQNQRGNVAMAFVENAGAAHTRIRVTRQGNTARFQHVQPGT